MSLKSNIIKLYFKDATITNKNYYNWDLLIPENAKHINTLKIDTISFPFSWYLFENCILKYNNGPTVTLNGSPNKTDLPGVLTALFGATSCTIDNTTYLITLVFGAPTTLNVNEWPVEARYFLGAGDAVLGPALSITFPYPVDLGGDQEIDMVFPATKNAIYGVHGGNVANKVTVPVDVNPFEVNFWQPDEYFLRTDSTTFETPFTVTFTNIWNHPIDFKGRNGFIQLRSF